VAKRQFYLDGWRPPRTGALIRATSMGQSETEDTKPMPMRSSHGDHDARAPTDAIA